LERTPKARGLVAPVHELLHMSQSPGEDANPNRICLLIRSLGVGGAERQLLELAQGLHARGVPVTVVTFYANGALQEAVECDGVRVVPANKRSRWDVIGFLWRLVRVIRAERPRVLYSFLPTANLLALLVRCFVHVDILAWGVRASSLDTASYGWLVRVELILAARLSRLANVIICNSSAGLLHHASLGYPAKRMTVIHNGIDTRRFSFDDHGRARLRAQWGVLGEEFLIGLVARMDPMKGHDLFIRSAVILAKQLPGMRFVCIGGETARSSCVRRTCATRS